jgi:Arf-GAP/SH3 domain/ANK repeat/PH domain-containing protein
MELTHTTVQDPESPSSQPPSFLLRLSNDDELIFSFTIVLRQTTSSTNSTTDTSTPTSSLDTVVNGLTFLFAPTSKDLDNLITKELHSDPNLHKNHPNVHLIGDYSTTGNPSVQFQWTWKWRPPKIAEDRGGGWRTCCSFVDYDQRNHRLNPLAVFTFWVQNSQKALSSPKSPSPRLEVVSAAKLRVPSAQSIDSRVSDSDGGTEPREGPAQSPTVEPIPEDGLGLVPTMTGTTMATMANPVKVDVNCQKPGENVSLSDDGPLFRATMKAMEQRTGSMRARWKRVLRKAEETQIAQQAANNSVAGLIDALRDASTSSSNAVRPAMEHYFDKIAKEILAYEQQNARNISKMIIEPIAKLYNVDIKQAESKKRDFEEESKEYYAYVSKYLGQRQDSLKEKKRAETDSKYQKKKRDFELKRFDYSSFMQDLHGGRKDQEVLSNLTTFAETQAQGYLKAAKKIEELLPQLEALIASVREADKDFRLQRTEREEKRRALEKGSDAAGQPTGALAAALQNGSGLGRSGSVSMHTALNTTTAPVNAVTTPSSVAGSASASTLVPDQSTTALLSSSPGQGNKFKGIRDLEERDYSTTTLDSKDGQKGKEGLVWAMSRPGSHADPKGLNKQAWHKYVHTSVSSITRPH